MFLSKARRFFHQIRSYTARLPGTLVALVRRVRWERVPLKSIEPSQQFASLNDGVRWMEPVTIGSHTLEALFCHPDASVSWRVQAIPSGQIEAYCGLMPEVWANVGSPVTFQIRVTDAEQRVSTRTIELAPAVRRRDRRWVRLAAAIPPSGLVDITLSTSVPPGASPAHAWAIWGEPSLGRPRPLREMWHQWRAALQNYGWRGAVKRALSPATLPLATREYGAWIARHAKSRAQLDALADEVRALPDQPLISIITPVFNTPPDLLHACIASIEAQVYERWELCIADDASTNRDTVAALARYRDHPQIHVRRLDTNSHISAASNAALSVARGEFVALLDHDDLLAPEALAEVVRELNAHPDTDVIYSDEDKLAAGGVRCDAFMKPDWSPEYFESCMYTCHLAVLRRSLLDAIGGFRSDYDGAQDYDLMLRAVERSDHVRHIPQVLYHWRKIEGSTAADPLAKPFALDAARRALVDHVARRGLDAVVEPGLATGLWRVRRRVRGTPSVTVIIPTDGRSAEMRGGTTDLVVNCVRSVVERTTYAHYELLIVDNGKLSEEALDLLRTVPHRRISYSYDPPFNFSRKLNFCVSHARGEHLVILNDDIEVIEPEWMTAMLEFSQDPGVGAVGCKLHYPDGRLQHVGVVTGVCGIAAHLFHQHPGTSTGYGGAAIAVRNYTAVTGACMMTRRAVFEQVGGFNERLRIDFNDVDYCLKVRRAGYRIVYTPYARLYHHESGSFGPRQQQPEEIDEMRREWGSVLSADPYYSPNLTVDFPDCRLRL